MKKILLGMSYGTFTLVCVAIIYGIGRGAYEIITTESLGVILGMSALGAVLVTLLVGLGLMVWVGIEAMFGNENSITYQEASKVNEEINKRL